VLFLPALLMILFRQKYPRWWFDWNLELLRFSNRIGIYLSLMDDTYPSTDEQQALHLDFPYPDAENELSRGMPLVKWLLAIPHYPLLFSLHVAASFSVLSAWFAFPLPGGSPRGALNSGGGVPRGNKGVCGSPSPRVTDKSPPFRLGP